MLRVYAMNFVRVGVHIDRCFSNGGAVKIPGEIADSSIKNHLADLIRTVENDSSDLKLLHTPGTVAHHKRLLERGDMTYRQIRQACEEIHRIYQSEIRNRMFVHVDPNLAWALLNQCSCLVPGLMKRSSLLEPKSGTLVTA